MKIKERLGSIRELQSQFDRVKKNEKQRPQRETRAAQEERARIEKRPRGRPERIVDDAVRIDERLSERDRKAESPERQERVNRIRTQVQDGRYEVDARDIARSLLRDLM